MATRKAMGPSSWWPVKLYFVLSKPGKYQWHVDLHIYAMFYRVQTKYHIYKYIFSMTFIAAMFNWKVHKPLPANKLQQILAMLVWSPNYIKAPGLRPIKTWRMHAHILQMPSLKSKCLHFHLKFPISFLKDGVDKNKDWIWEKSGEQARPLRLMFCRRHFRKYLYLNSKFPI